MKRNDVNICDPRRGLVVFDLVLLFVQLPGSKQIVDGLVILRDPNQK